MLPALLLALALLPNPALAYQSFTASLSFYQGLNLTTGMTAFDPRILTLIINPSAHVNLVLSPESEPNLFHFSPDINLYFSYDPTHAAPITLTPHALQGVAVLSGADATAITPAMLAGLSFITTPVAIGADDLAMLWLKDSAYMVFERVTQLPDWTVQVDYRQIQAVPEPSAAILMGVGGADHNCYKNIYSNISEGETSIKRRDHMILILIMISMFVIDRITNSKKLNHYEPRR